MKTSATLAAVLLAFAACAADEPALDPTGVWHVDAVWVEPTTVPGCDLTSSFVAEVWVDDGPDGTSARLNETFAEDLTVTCDAEACDLAAHFDPGQGTVDFDLRATPDGITGEGSAYSPANLCGQRFVVLDGAVGVPFDGGA
jgi:hypothetical protein